jgi:hypothetical protein
MHLQIQGAERVTIDLARATVPESPAVVALSLRPSMGSLKAKTGRILLANLFQSSRSTFSWGSFSSFLAFQEGMWDTQISELGGSPTVSAR